MSQNRETGVNPTWLHALMKDSRAREFLRGLAARVLGESITTMTDTQVVECLSALLSSSGANREDTRPDPVHHRTRVARQTTVRRRRLLSREEATPSPDEPISSIWQRASKA